MNHHSDGILRNLRKDDNDRNHYIPRGGLFEYVSGANFFAESVEWLGYAIAANSIVAFCFFFNTMITTGARASAHHDWYINKFQEEYPRSRKRFIPFIW